MTYCSRFRFIPERGFHANLYFAHKITNNWLLNIIWKSFVYPISFFSYRIRPETCFCVICKLDLQGNLFFAYENRIKNDLKVRLKLWIHRCVSVPCWTHKPYFPFRNATLTTLASKSERWAANLRSRNDKFLETAGVWSPFLFVWMFR